jgi:hypothetical protein
MNLKKYVALIGLITLISCSEKKIIVIEDRLALPEPDRELRINYDVNESIHLISKEIAISDEITTCEHGKRIINSGKEILPFLKEKFTDSTETKVYSSFNKRNLTFGELAIILASEIKSIPIAYVVGIQQCTPPFDMDIEYYLGRIKENPRRFVENYTKWIQEEM